MSVWQTWVFGGTALLAWASTLSTLFHQRWVRRLPALDALPSRPATDGSSVVPVRCSVVIAARDEEVRVDGTIRRLLAQQGVEVDVVLVDDRSIDRTGERARRLASEDARVQVLRVDLLPEGWLGKCHACYLGAQAASAPWILFTDADCWLKPDVLDRALRVARHGSVDHVTLTPGVTPLTAAAHAWHLAFLASLAPWISGANRDRPGAHVGIGAFNLVRASVYRASGGHETLRLTVMDDIKLGLLVRRAGGRTRGFIGGDDVECHWGPTVPAMLRLMEKNFFAAAEFNAALVVIVPVAVTMALGAIIAGAWSRTALGSAAALAPLSLMLPAAVFARRLGWPIRMAVLTPFLYPVLIYAFVRSAVVTLRQGGIWWRETFYPLDVLRKGRVR